MPLMKALFLLHKFLQFLVLIDKKNSNERGLRSETKMTFIDISDTLLSFQCQKTLITIY